MRVGLAAFDEDAGKDWPKYGPQLIDIGDAVAGLLVKSGTPEAVVSAAIAVAAPRVFGLLVTADKDDELGQLALDVPASGPVD